MNAAPVLIRRLLPLLFGLLATLMLALPASAAQRTLSTRGESIDRVVAIVNDGVVLQSALDQEIALITERLRQQKTQLPADGVLRQQVLEKLISEELQMQRAHRGGLRITDDMLNNALSDVASRNNISFSDLPKAIESQGQNYAAYREQVRHDLTLQVLQQQAVVANIVVTPRELDQFLAKQTRQPDSNAEYNLSHILVAMPSNASAEQQAQREARAREVLGKLGSGSSFAELAVAYSDSSTNVQGGALGWRSGSQLPSIIADKIPAMKNGEVTELIRTPSGFHIFRLNETRGGGDSGEHLQVQSHARHILLKTSEIEDDNTIKQRLEKIRTRVLAGEDFAAIAAVTSQDTGSAIDGGDLGWAGPGAFVPEFDQAMAKLKDNELSEPVKTQYGWHLIQLLGRRTQDVSEDMRRGKAQNALRMAKAEDAVELWLRELRAEAFVEILQ